MDISHFLSQRKEIWQQLWPIDTYSLNFVNFGPVGESVIPCGDMHLHWYTYKVVVRQLPMFADSFSVLSIHCFAQGLGASSLHKCPASRDGSL